MLTKNELHQAALRTVNARRQMARARAEDARIEAQAAIPALRHAEEEVRVRGIRYALAAASGKDSSAAAQALSEARQNLASLLISSGRSPEALEPKFSCTLCQDTGYHEGRTCECVRKEMRRMRREEIETLSSLSVQSFDTMKLEYYPNVKDSVSGQNVRSYMAGLIEDLRGYAEDFDLKSENLMLIGNAGLGKTHAALAIAGAALEKGFDVIYVSSPDFFGRIEELRFGSDPDGEREILMQTAVNADLLILDDLGTEFNSSFLISMLYSLLNDRLGAHKPTIVTSNVTDGSLLEKMYTEKISSRLASFVPCRFIGEDIRLIRSKEI